MTEAAQLQCPLHDFVQLMKIERLEEVLEGTAFHGFDGGLRGGKGGDEDYGQSRVDLADTVERFQSGHVPQANVEEHDVRPVAFDQFEALRRTLGCQDGHAFRAEDLFNRIQHIGFVVDDQQARHGFLA